ncbi:aryl-alcohol dehydrogenase [Aspergillus avenaceus]|uniref:Aryl-alcohol dehydrogenase n=1 Tax=Aspergillus avenaceus TaxID=36643 RepID=A0A5N6U6J2_ASPAV|nr:aryl-alcohol dehydrogenase [Aspergillus avenaceus]
MALNTSSLSDLRPEYDYVIIGGGTAGLVVANRLTEDENISVLVLEAGSNRVNDPRIMIPGLASSTYFDPEFDWCITSPPQEALNGRCIAEPRGRTLGGSSAINLGMIIYPSRNDLDAWEKLGNPGWNWESLSGYLRKSQTFTAPSGEIRRELSVPSIDPAVRGTDGPLHVSYGEGPFAPFSAAWPKTFQTLHESKEDPLSGFCIGAFCNPGSIHATTRARSHAGIDYYNAEVAQRPNLRVITEALVEKALLQKTENGDVVATGVQFIGKDGVRRTVSAGAEVILAAGAVKTPHILELSGIGNPTLLQAHGIDPIIDNSNVGENLQEHGFVPFSWEVADGQVTGEAIRDPALLKLSMETWQTSGAGPLGLCPFTSAFMSLPGMADGELQNLFKQHLGEDANSSRAAQYRILRQRLEDTDDTGQYTMVPCQLTPEKGPSPKGVFALSEPESFISIVAVLNHPFSRGSVHLASSDPVDLPTFDPQLLSHPLDMELQARHVQVLERLAETEPMASLLKKGGRRLHHSERVSRLEIARQLTRDRIIAHYHVVGTASMMPQEIGGVVDERLRVYGSRNLRVIDASVIPLIPRGNIQTTVYAVAEKAADIIKADRSAA